MAVTEQKIVTLSLSLVTLPLALVRWGVGFIFKTVLSYHSIWWGALSAGTDF
jgi:hypothetical protein